VLVETLMTVTAIRTAKRIERAFWRRDGRSVLADRLLGPAAGSW